MIPLTFVILTDHATYKSVKGVSDNNEFVIQTCMQDTRVGKNVLELTRPKNLLLLIITNPEYNIHFQTTYVCLIYETDIHEHKVRDHCHIS